MNCKSNPLSNRAASTKRFLINFFGVCCAVIPLRSFAVGNIDYTFSAPSTDEPIYAVAVDSHTNIWIGGAFGTVGGRSYSALAVLNPDGSLNTNYTFNFGTVTFGYVVALAVDYEDSVYVAWRGYSGGQGVARLVTQGSGWVLDTSYGNNINPRLRGLESIACGVFPSRELYVAGSITNNAGFHPLAHFASDGTIIATADFPSLGVFTDSILHLTYRPPGAAIINGQGYTWSESLLIAGTFGAASVWMDGSVNESYPPPSGEIFSCAAQRDNGDALRCPSLHGEMLASGQTAPFFQYGTGFHDSYIGMNLERLGTSDSTNYFRPISQRRNYPADNGANIARIVALPDGDMLVAGQFTSIRGRNVQNFAHLLADGSVDPNFANGSGISVLDVTRQPDGKYLLAGYGYNHNGFLERRQALPASGVSFNSQPQNQTVYVGDSAAFSADVTAWPQVIAQWKKDGATIAGQTNMEIFFSQATTNNAGQYQVSVQNGAFCPIAGLSSNATLTVLPPPPPPPNDMFSNAFPLSGLAVIGNGTIRSATLESGETDHLGVYAGRSAWWTWTAPFSGQAAVDVSGCDFQAAIGVFTGPAASGIAGLAVVTNNYDYGNACECAGLLTNFSFHAAAGTTYQIAIGGAPSPGSLGHIAFTIAPVGGAWVSNTSATANFLRGVATGNGRIVAVGANGTIVTSGDAIHWTLAASPVSDALWSVAYGNGKFVATGDNGDILVSTDGLNWQQQTSGIVDTLSGVAFGDGVFVAVAPSDVVLTSTDGVNWTKGTTGTGDYLIGAAFANGLFFAETPNGLVYSSNGVHWSVGSVDVSDYFYSTAYGNNLFVSAGVYGSIVTSTSGTNWNQVTNDASFHGITFGAGRFIAVGANGLVKISTNGTNWIQDPSGTTSSLNAIATYNGSQFVVVGQNGIILVSQPPRIGPRTRQNDGTFQFSLTGFSGSMAVIQATTTLSPPDWQPVATNTIVNGIVTFSDSSATKSKYYRALVSP
jgi:Immunoglobulin I-set domain/Domain of unknown function (DUF5122) beta-propeller